MNGRLTFLLFLCRVLVLVGAVLHGVAMVMHFDFSGRLVGVGMLVKVPVGMGVGMLVGVNTRFMLMLMVMRMGMFVGMQVLMFRRIFHDRVPLEVNFPKFPFIKTIEFPSRQPGRQEGNSG
jgi:hypothetical protein